VVALQGPMDEAPAVEAVEYGTRVLVATLQQAIGALPDEYQEVLGSAEPEDALIEAWRCVIWRKDGAHDYMRLLWNVLNPLQRAATALEDVPARAFKVPANLAHARARAAAAIAQAGRDGTPTPRYLAHLARLAHTWVAMLAASPHRLCTIFSPIATTTMSTLSTNVRSYAKETAAAAAGHPEDALAVLFSYKGLAVERENVPDDARDLLRALDEELPLGTFVPGKLGGAGSLTHLQAVKREREKRLLEFLGPRLGGVRPDFARVVLGVGPASRPPDRPPTGSSGAPSGLLDKWVPPFNFAVPRTPSATHTLVVAASSALRIVAAMDPRPEDNPWNDATLWHVCSWITATRAATQARTMFQAQPLLLEASRVLARLGTLCGGVQPASAMCPPGHLFIPNLEEAGVVEPLRATGPLSVISQYTVTNVAFQGLGAAVMDTIALLRGVVALDWFFPRVPPREAIVPPPAYYPVFGAVMKAMCHCAHAEEVSSVGMRFAVASLLVPGDVEEFTQIFQEKPTAVTDPPPITAETANRILRRLRPEDCVALDVFTTQAPGVWVPATFAAFPHHAAQPPLSLKMDEAAFSSHPIGLADPPMLTFGARAGAGAGVGVGAGASDTGKTHLTSSTYDAVVAHPGLASAMLVLAFFGYARKRTGVDFTACLLPVSALLGASFGRVGPFHPNATTAHSVVPPTIVHCGGHGFMVIFRGRIHVATPRVGVLVYVWATLVLEHLHGTVPHSDGTLDITPFLWEVLGIEIPAPGTTHPEVATLAAATQASTQKAHLHYSARGLRLSAMWHVIPPAGAHEPLQRKRQRVTTPDTDADADAGPDPGGDVPDIEAITASTSARLSAEAYIGTSGVMPDAMNTTIITPDPDRAAYIPLPRVHQTLKRAAQAVHRQWAMDSVSHVNQVT